MYNQLDESSAEFSFESNIRKVDHHENSNSTIKN